MNSGRGPASGRSLDETRVVIEVSDQTFSLELQKQMSFLDSVRKRISMLTGIHVSVKVVDPRSLPRQEGKIIPVIDKRQI